MNLIVGLSSATRDTSEKRLSADNTETANVVSFVMRPSTKHPRARHRGSPLIIRRLLFVHKINFTVIFRVAKALEVHQGRGVHLCASKCIFFSLAFIQFPGCEYGQQGKSQT